MFGKSKAKDSTEPKAADTAKAKAPSKSKAPDCRGQGKAARSIASKEAARARTPPEAKGQAQARPHHLRPRPVRHADDLDLRLPVAVHDRLQHPLAVHLLLLGYRLPAHDYAALGGSGGVRDHNLALLHRHL